MHLEDTRVRMKYLEDQKRVLATPKDRKEKLADIRAIVEMSLVKNGFIREKIKQHISMGKAFLCLPLACYFGYPGIPKDQSTYEGKNNDFLPSGTDLQKKYKNIVDAHNTLFKEHPFVVPYVVPLNIV